MEFKPDNTSVDLRKVSDTKTRDAELEKREQFLHEAGFSNEWIMNLKEEEPSLYDPIHAQSIIDFLKISGFTNPIKMITTLPPILGLAIGNIQKKIEDLKALGFADPHKMIMNTPLILGFTINNLTDKMDNLKALGFNDTQKMINKEPAILNLATNNVKQKIEDLKALGFTDSIKMITTFPSILGLAIGNIQKRIEDLQRLGFSDPIKMITTSPPILGLAIDNIKGKLSTLNNIFKLYNIKIEVNHFVEKNLSLLGTKIDKIWIVARALRTLNLDLSEISETLLSKLLFSNITNVTVAISLLNQKGERNFTKEEVSKAIKEATEIPQTEKEIILNKQKDSRLGRRYARGYGKLDI